ncbi:tRNA pseudouridine(38-40) synthase TruA [Hypericibacter sp.]|uniref:tRNA pseudouridine(38-40) synthase TruA n=1 Tax=Hypericibacter sp. TaxID=2705401 RepID=UPI003D6D0455
MTRYKLTLEYDGGPFVGWQRQSNGLSVQEALEEAIFAFCGERPNLFAAGRTDAGVHARGQVAHVDLQREADSDTVRKAINFHVKPHPVSVLAVEPVDDEFHARFSAKWRAYRYDLLNRRSPLTIDRGHVWLVNAALDVEAMAAGARHLLGHHDFTSFRSSICQAASPMKTLDVLEIQRNGETIEIRARARSFLHHQVRNMVGTLKLVGEGKWTPDDVAKALAAKDRSAAGPTAPPDGLYLMEVGY